MTHEESHGSTGRTVSQDFARLVVGVQRPLFAYVLSLFPEPLEAEEILQNTNLKLMAEHERLDDVRDFDGWARRLAYFEYLAHCKRKSRGRLDLVHEDLLMKLADASFERASEMTDKLSALEQCERKLVRADRELLSARYREGRAVAEIAERTRRTPAAIRQVLCRIRRALLDCMRVRLSATGDVT
jgi:RNA polymerase sigma-70 factor (ECF subfamily)